MKGAKSYSVGSKESKKYVEISKKFCEIITSVKAQILFDIPDENREFLDSLKSIEYEQKSEQWYYSRNRYRAISYSLDRDFTIAICQDETEPEHFVYDSLEVYVQSYEQYPISGNNFFYYEINPSVGKELVNKANEIMKAYVKSHQNKD